MIDLISLEYQHEIFHNELRDILLEYMQEEGEYINICLKYNTIIVEADNNTQVNTQQINVSTSPNVTNINKSKSNLGQRIKDLFDKIVEFFKNLFNRFFRNVTKMIESEHKWLGANKQRLLNLNYDNLQAQIMPYWIRPANSINNELNKLCDLMSEKPDVIKESPITKDSVYTFLETKQLKLKDMDFKTSLKKMFTVGAQNTMEHVTISGNELRTKIIEVMIPYVETFSDKVVKDLETKKNTVIQSIKAIKTDMKSKGFVIESLCMLENKLYSEILSCCENYNIFMEDTKTTKVTNPDGSVTTTTVKTSTPTTPPKNSQRNTNPVTMTSKESQPKSGEVDVSKKDENKTVQNYEKGNYDSFNQDGYNFIFHICTANELAIGQAMNCQVEQFRSYMKVLKGCAGKK